MEKASASRGGLFSFDVYQKARQHIQMQAVYEIRSRQLGQVRDSELLRDGGRFPEVLALLAVHAAIATNDALLIALTGSRPKGDNHTDAADQTQRACAERKLEDKGLRHLRELLSKKTAISYGDRTTPPDVAEALAQSSIRFEEWANRAQEVWRKKNA